MIMKDNEIFAKLAEYHIPPYVFINYLEKNRIPHKSGIFSEMGIDDSVLEAYLNGEGAEYVRKSMMSKEAKAEKAAREAEEALRKKKAMAEMLITSGFNFDGYTIKKYSGYISGDDAMSVDRGVSFLGLGGDSARDELMSSLAKIRRNALRELKEAAYDLGCNAVIGVDFDYITLDPQTHNIGGGTKLQPYVFGVTANGNAVIIEKDED